MADAEAARPSRGSASHMILYLAGSRKRKKAEAGRQEAARTLHPASVFSPPAELWAQGALAEAGTEGKREYRNRPQRTQKEQKVAARPVIVCLSFLLPVVCSRCRGKRLRSGEYAFMLQRSFTLLSVASCRYAVVIAKRLRLRLAGGFSFLTLPKGRLSGHSPLDELL